MLLAMLVSAPLAAGGYILSLGAREIRSAYRTETDDPIPIDDVHRHSGPVVLEGKAVFDSETLTAPFSGTESLAYTYETHENIDVRNSWAVVSSGRERTEDEWVILDDGAAAVEFVVEDETGRVRVDPTGADLQFETETYDPVPWRDIPGPLVAYIESTSVVERRDIESFVRWLKTPARRFREGRLEPEESVYVRGCVQPTADTDPVAAVVGECPDTSTFVVADTNQRGVFWRDAKRGLLYLGMSLAFLFVSGLIFLSNV